MRWLAIAAIIMLAGCHERSFDDRYADAEKTIRDKSRDIDAEIASQAAVAGPDASGAQFSSQAPASLPGER